MIHAPEINPPAGRGSDACAVAPAEWRDAVEVALAEGWVFAGLHAVPVQPDPGCGWTLAVAEPITCWSAPLRRRRIASIIDPVPAAVWDEREADDLNPAELRRPRAAAADRHHGVADREVKTPEGRGPTPSRSPSTDRRGRIESGHFRFHVVGEADPDIRAAAVRSTAASRPPSRGADHVAIACNAQRASPPTPSPPVAYAQAWPRAPCGLRPQADVRRAWTLLLELERLYNHPATTSPPSAPGSGSRGQHAVRGPSRNAPSGEHYSCRPPVPVLDVAAVGRSA